MANITEELSNPQWAEGIYQLETTDPVLGGPNGIANRQAKELAARTQYLKKKQEEDKPGAVSTSSTPPTGCSACCQWLPKYRARFLPGRTGWRPPPGR